MFQQFAWPSFRFSQLGNCQSSPVSWWPRTSQRFTHSTCSLLGQLGRQCGYVPSTTQGRCCLFCCRAHRSSHSRFPLQGAVASRGFLHSVGFETAEWPLADCFRPREPVFSDIKPGVPTHVWQFFAARAIEEHFVSSSVLPRLSPTESALYVHSLDRWLSVVPSSSFAGFCPPLFRVLLLRRLWLPLPLSSRTCRCGRLLDVFGHHCAACSRAGVLGSRGFAFESAAARVCREGRARVATNMLLRDLDVPVPLSDNRRLEVVSDGLPLFKGAQLTVDTTLVSPVCSNGEVRGRSAVEDGAALSSARRCKVRTYPELCGPHSRVRLVVLAAETGGRWSEEAQSFLSQLAKARARSVPRILRGRARQVWQHRWSSLLACAASRAFALSLLDRRPGCGSHGVTPSSSDVLSACRHLPTGSEV